MTIHTPILFRAIRLASTTAASGFTSTITTTTSNNTGRTPTGGPKEAKQAMEFLEVPLFDEDVYKLLVRLGINLLSLTLIVACAIYPHQREREFAFTAVMLNLIVFFICFTMKKLELDLGLALGLFAVFGVLRYRTDAIRVKEMTYLFIVIGIAIINSLSNKQTSYTEIALVNFLIFFFAMLKEWIVGREPASSNSADANAGISAEKELEAPVAEKKTVKLTVRYDRLDLLGNEHRETMLADLRQRTGLPVTKVAIESIDLLKNQSTLTIWSESGKKKESS